MNRFNVWRRLGLALCALALTIAATVAAVEWHAKNSGVFVYRMLLPGSIIEAPTNQVILPSGEVVPLKEGLNGREPWQIDWNTEPGAAPVLVLNWTRVLKLGLVLPLAIWLMLEIVALLGRWMFKGIRRPLEGLGGEARGSPQITASAFQAKDRDHYIQEAKIAAFQDAVFLINFYNKDVRRSGPWPKPPEIAPEEIFVSFDMAEYKICLSRANSLMASSYRVGAAFFSYPSTSTYKDELIVFKEKNPGYAERSYALAAGAGIRDMR